MEKSLSNNQNNLFIYDSLLRNEYGIICGIDEAGRGPFAGDVYAAAVIFSDDVIIEGINDSKKLSEKKREELFDAITSKAVAYSIATASVREIDELNILNATMLAMKRAFDGLSVKPKVAFIDGNKTPVLDAPCEAIVKGDAKSASIAAASILAKVSRDRYMKELAEKYPQYQFEKHKGYGTALHIQMLDKYGISEVHRMSFLKKYLAKKRTMKTDKQQKALKGKIGEEFTAEYLSEQGYRIVMRNYRKQCGEIDIIAQKDDVIAFVEVKTRKYNSLVSGIEAVGYKKKSRIIATAECYLYEYGLEYQPRYDIAEVTVSNGENVRVIDFEYYEAAFDTTGFETHF